MDPEGEEVQPVAGAVKEEVQVNQTDHTEEKGGNPTDAAVEKEVSSESDRKIEPEPEKKIDAEEEKKVTKSGKIEVRLQAVGDAPIMKQKNYKVDGEKQISWILAFIRKFLKLKTTDALFLYVNQAFAPSPDQTVANLADCFGQDNKLVLYYSRSQAYG